MATVVINGEEQARGSGESEFPKFIIDGRLLTIQFTDTDVAAGSGPQMMFATGNYDSNGDMRSATYVFRPAPPSLSQ